MSSQHFPFRQSEEDHEHPNLREQFTLAAHDLADHDQFGYAKGTLGYAEVTSNQDVASGNTDDLTGLSVTVDVDADRRIEITGYARVQSNGTGATTSVLIINEGSSVLQKCHNRHDGTGGTHANNPHAAVVLTPSAGSHTYKLSLQAVHDDLRMFAASDQPAFILVEDVGAA